MASSSFPLTLLPLHLPNSPLLSGSFTDDFAATLLAQGICNPLPPLSFASAPSARRQQAGVQLHASSMKTVLQNKPLPNLPIPPREIISLLDLLEKMDDDILKEVQRVRENVKEARAVMREFREERARRRVGAQQKREREEKETKGPDDEFWLNA